MAKGISMPIARWANDRRRIKADAVDDASGPFICFSCGVSVDHVNGYWTHKDDPNLMREFKAFFRLKGGHEHASGCTYVPSAQVKAIVSRAEAVEDSINPFEKDSDRDIWIFRLNIPAEEQAREAENDPGLQASNTSVRTERVWNGKRLESFCRSAVGLAKLWRALESPDSQEAQDELRSRVRIAVAGKVIPWEEFFFSENDMSVLADRLQANAISYPVALLLHVKQIEESSTQKSVIFTHIRNDGLKGETRIAVEAFGKGVVLSDFSVGCHYIIFGEFYYAKSKLWQPTGRSVPIVFRDIRLRIFRRSQYDLIEAFSPLAD